MEERVARVYRFKKVLKYSILSLIITILGLLVFEYFRIKPNNVYFTNITSSSVTVSWDTKVKTDATATYVEPENKLPFLILPIFKERFFDTRDITKAELEAAQQSSQNQEGLEVTMNEMVTNISVIDRGRYYTHHIEIKGLDPDKEYSFMVGDSLIFRKVKDVNNETIAKTYAIPESILTPFPAYGSVVDAQGRFDLPMEEMEIINDGILYFNFYDKSTGEKSNLFSSPLNEKGRWYIDVSGAIDKNGNLFPSTPNAEEEINIYAELRFNGGKIGTFSRLDNAGIISPTNDIVLNLPETEMSFQNNMLSPFITNFIASVNAAGQGGSCGGGQGTCTWVTYCDLECRAGDGSKYYYTDEDDGNNCSPSGIEFKCEIPQGGCSDPDERKSRNCDGANPETDFCTKNDGSRQDVDTDPIIDAGKCRQCFSKKGDGPTYYAAWKDLSMSACTSPEPPSNSPEQSADALVCERHLGSWNIELDRCDCKANAEWVTSTKKTCRCKDGYHNVKNVCKLDTTDTTGNGSEQNDDSEEDNCLALPLTDWDGSSCQCISNANPIATNNNVSSKGCECNTNYGEINGNGRCISNLSPNAGDTCTAPGIAYGRFNNDGECIPRTTECSAPGILYGEFNDDGDCIAQTELTQEQFKKLNCWRFAGTGQYYIYYDGDRYICGENNTPIKVTTKKWDTLCKVGEWCSYGDFTDSCVNMDTGRILYCWYNAWIIPEEGNIDVGLIGIGTTPPKEIKKGDTCNNDSPQEPFGGCNCESVKDRTLLEDETCPEVTECKASNEGRICDTYGNECENVRIYPGKVEWECGDSGSSSSTSIIELFQPKLFAQEQPSPVVEEKYIIDQTTGMISGIEEGVYTFEIDGEKYNFNVIEVASKKGDVFIFIDMNNNGVFDEGTDKKLSEFGSEITVQVIKKAYTYKLVKGYNFISFPFLNENKKARTASGMLTMLNDFTNGAIYSISKYDGSWKIVGQNGKKYEGKDFQLVPGQGYIIKSTKNVEVRISGYPVKYESPGDTAPITLMPGWNLIGLYGTNVKSYTAKSMIQDINAFETVDFTADNVSKWESDVQRYEGYQLTNENGIDIEYGFDYPINILQSYFVRVNQGTGNWQPLLAE